MSRLENRVIFQMTMLGILIPYLYKFQVLLLSLENQSIQGLQQSILLVCVLSFPATAQCHLYALLECKGCCLLQGYLDTGHGGMEGRAAEAACCGALLALLKVLISGSFLAS